jgi:hypothetical protein
MRLLSYVFLLCCFFLAACDAPYSYEYRINNQCDTSILVVVKKGRDTIMYVPRGISKTVYFTSRIEKHGGPRFRDVKYDFDTIFAYKNGIRSRRNYLSNEYWQFEKTSDALGSYTATITDTDF